MQLIKSLAVGAAMALPAVQATYQCPISAPPQVTALKYAYAVQDFLYQYYKANGPFSASDFSDFPMAQSQTNENITLAQALATNMNGLTQQANLGVEAIQQLASMVNSDASSWSTCPDYSYPPLIGMGSMDFVQAIYYIEATLCGTFIGLADYVQTPQAAFLMARLSAEHGIHASFLGHYFKATPYSADSMALTPAFTPDHVLMPGSGMPVRPNVGYLGKYIPESCAPVPPAPCGNSVEIGNLLATLSGGMGSMPSGMGNSSYGPAPTGSMPPASSGSYAPQPATGAGNKGSANGMLAGLGGAAAALAML